MDNQTDISVNESKPKSHGCLIAFLITFAVIILHIAAIPVLIEIVDHIPRTKDTQTNGQYVVELQASMWPDKWPVEAYQILGVNLEDEQVYVDAIKYFDSLVEQFDAIYKE